MISARSAELVRALKAHLASRLAYAGPGATALFTTGLVCALSIIVRPAHFHRFCREIRDTIDRNTQFHSFYIPVLSEAVVFASCIYISVLSSTFMKYGAEGIKFHNTNLFGFLIVVVAINVITPWPLLSAGIAATLCLTFCMLVARGYEATYRHRQARTALGRYLPISVVEEVTSRPTDLRVNGVRREIVALFSDLEGFTSLSEDIDAQTLSALINDYLDILAALVDRFSGTLDKFIGDGMVAFWSAPSVSTAEAQAVLAALAISKAGGDFAARIASDGIALGRTRVGVCGGPAIVGHFGGSTRLQYTALGNAMNTASRLESANKALHTGVLVSDDVMRASGLACFRPMGRIRLAGLASPLIAWEASDLDPALNLDLTRLWTDFDAGDFGALDTLDRLSRERPSDRALVAVVARLRQEGPGGTFTLPVK